MGFNICLLLDDLKCHMGGYEETPPETQIHVLSACGPMSMIQYKIRHDAVAKSVHQQILRAYGADYNRRYWWKKTPPRSVILPDGGYLRWDPKLRTTTRLEHDQPDLLLKTPSGNLYIIEFTVCTDQAVATRHNEKMVQYQVLAWVEDYFLGIISEG